ncbi:glycerol-3-phosphate 1-O-acyltransferase PlsY [Lichenicola cladoniae]|uniref:Glycerol-3-phosphate acyltransferase n=1 Tax=Lichenicola cladoniae TaxID=1484109 RepID=A0A6M8HT65_9PROT|nr:glycerol-3-phosphate 1-O-acyltransferase PlsY [Lichenicola cladoniae]NPD65389.1 glycerol-3-phosphate 1-O-acyltransferase PlsY [Acetobacteraceae bacterium]QKE91532.1 glycerol-3-phosphate 1-O-acyltransferase PlsY [Lichenicola cladoniae]
MSAAPAVDGIVLFAAAGLLSYVIGSIPFGLIITDLGGAGDIRQIGSGNIGATNVLRTGRRGLAAATLLLDGFKGFFAVVLCGALLPLLLPDVAALAAVCVVAGHCLPVWLKFRGGKGVATGLGVALGLDWRVGLICCVLWLLVARLTRISSAGALAAMFVLGPLLLAFDGGHLVNPVPWAGLAVGLGVFLRHKDNIGRLLAGTEPRIGRKTA